MRQHSIESNCCDKYNAISFLEDAHLENKIIMKLISNSNAAAADKNRLFLKDEHPESQFILKPIYLLKLEIQISPKISIRKSNYYEIASANTLFRRLAPGNEIGKKTIH